VFLFTQRILETTTCFGLSLGHHQVDHLFVMRQLYNMPCQAMAWHGILYCCLIWNKWSTWWRL